MKAAGGSTLLGGFYAHDAAGRITAVTTTGTAKDCWAYAYDALDRLTAANNGNDNTLDQTFAWIRIRIAVEKWTMN